MTPDEARIHAAHDAMLVTHGGKLRYEAVIPHADGSQRTLLINKVAVPGNDGKTASILCAFVDITEFRQVEQATREARDAAEANSRAKSEFIANISHELRTPLQAIIGFSEIGMSRATTPERTTTMFTHINSSGQRMLAMVNDLLDVSKIESAVGSFNLTPTDLRELVRSVGTELTPLLQRRGLSLDIRLPETPMMAQADSLRFQQVVRNVLANAIKFSPAGQAIELTGGSSTPGQWKIRVRDHGPGIPEGELEDIFDAFIQSSRTKDGAGGTGLGLAICRKIMDAHGGTIQASNADGGGACIELVVPGV
jgi:signal transduction histidine kinase